MALSCYSNLEELEAHLNSDMNMFVQPQLELPPELFGFDTNFSVSDSFVDPFWESHDLFYSNTSHSLLPYISSPPENPNSLVSEIFPAYEYEPYPPYLKRQKVYEEMTMPGLFNDFVRPNQSLSPEIFGPFPHFASGNPTSYSSCKVVEAPKKPAGSLSAQSIAARQRRRKITEKTQELGKLIPGGQKMNTAEMFQAAFKYIKFLQAQVGILETIASIRQENEDSFENQQEMELLLGSSLIHEKLYNVEKFLVPKKLVESLANHHKFRMVIDRHSSSDVKK